MGSLDVILSLKGAYINIRSYLQFAQNHTGFTSYFFSRTLEQDFILNIFLLLIAPLSTITTLSHIEAYNGQNYGSSI